MSAQGTGTINLYWWCMYSNANKPLSWNFEDGPSFCDHVSDTFFWKFLLSAVASPVPQKEKENKCLILKKSLTATSTHTPDAKELENKVSDKNWLAKIKQHKITRRFFATWLDQPFQPQIRDCASSPKVTILLPAQWPGQHSKWILMNTKRH